MTVQYLHLFSDESRDGIYRRLQKLFHHGHLDRIGCNPNAPMIYGLARRGAEVLAVPARKAVGDRYIAHQLMIGDFRIALTLAARQRSITLSWETFVGDGLPVRPDGFFGLRFPELPDGRNRAFFMLEADRSTMTRERFVRKLVAYREWYDAGGHVRALGIKNFRVLIVTKSEQRMTSLMEAARLANAIQPDLYRYWFSSETSFTPEVPWSIFGPIWETPADPGRTQTILPASASLAAGPLDRQHG